MRCPPPCIIGSSGDLSDDSFAGGRVGRRVGDEDGEGDLPAVGKRDQTDVVGGGSETVVHIRRAGLVGDAGALG